MKFIKKNIVNVVVFGISGKLGKYFIDLYTNKKINLIFATYNDNENFKNKEKINTHYICTKKRASDKLIKKYLSNNNIDIAFNFVKGFEGLKYSILIIKNNITLGLANKETLVAAGEYIIDLAQKNNVSIIPIDSEHSAIYKIIENQNIDVKNLIITASGGAFFNYSDVELKKIKYEQVFEHPTWDMGKEITINSSTMINKAFEIIEAKYFFNVNLKNIKVFINRNSWVHGAVCSKLNEYFLYASHPTMILPINVALNLFLNKKIIYKYKDIHNDNDIKLNLLSTKSINNSNNIALSLAYDSYKKNYYEITLLISNEFFVNKFINKEILFYEIIHYVYKIYYSFVPSFPYDSKDIDHIYKIKDEIILFCNNVYNKK